MNKLSMRRAPHVNGVPGLGILPRVWRDLLGSFVDLARQYGDVFQFELGPRPFFMVNGPEQVRYILQENNKNYVKGYEIVQPLLGLGLVTSDGELWLRQRRLIQPMFNRASLVSLLPIMAAATQEVIGAWRSRPDPARPLDMASELMLLTQTIILRTMFSTDIGGQSREIATAFTHTLAYLNSALVSPFPILRRLPTPTNRRFQRAKAQVDAVIFQMIAERQKKGSPERHDLLGTLMQARDEQTGQGMSAQQMHDEVLTIFLAGHETTATLLAWTFHLLAQHPDVEAAVRQEFARILDGRTPTADEINSLTYTRQVLDETLRLYPPAWMFARRSVEDDEVGGYHVPARSMMFISPYVTHHLPAYWPEPERFDPQRFTPEAIAGRPRYAYYPFGGGPRQCIGQGFALMEAPLILSMLMQAFRFEPQPGKIVKANPGATLRPGPALWMKVTKI